MIRPGHEQTKSQQTQSDPHVFAFLASLVSLTRLSRSNKLRVLSPFLRIDQQQRSARDAKLKNSCSFVVPSLRFAGLPLMTDEEVDPIIIDHYENESQTLTTGAEANPLKFRK
jgi:hypothetical protein